MPVPEKLTATVSTRGQIILPKAIRLMLRWEAGTRLVVESAPQGVLLKPAPVFAETRSKEVFGLLARDGAPKSLTEMEAGVLAEARRRHGAVDAAIHYLTGTGAPGREPWRDRRQ